MSKIALVVDDSQVIREVVGFTLGTADFEILYAANGNEALDISQNTKIDLLITDLHMPQMNGTELIWHIRQSSRYKNLPAIMLTTETGQGHKQQARQAGATAWIVKPFVPEQLFEALKKVLR